MQGVMLFGFKGNLSPIYVDSFPMVGRVGPVAYRVQLLEYLVGVHNLSSLYVEDECW